MATGDYLCLTCGKHYVTVKIDTESSTEQKCPHCEGANVMKLNLDGISSASRAAVEALQPVRPVRSETA